jgi:hypothetical protein
MDEVPKCTQLIIVGTFSDGKTKTLVFPEPEKWHLQWAENEPEAENILTPSQAEIFKPKMGLGVGISAGERGVLYIQAPLEE